MSAAGKARSAARGWATRAAKRLETLCREDELDCDELEDAVMDFDRRLAALDQTQGEAELELSVQDLETDIEAAADFRERVRGPRLEAGKRLKRLLSVSEDRQEQRSDDGSKTAAAANLPKIELPKFSGDPLEWTAFWEQFCAAVDSTDLPEVSKFNYLRSLLRGNAKAAIQGLSLTAAHYRGACEILQGRFGRPEKIIFSHIQELLKIGAAKQGQVVSLCNLVDDLLAKVRSLEALDITGQQYGVILTPLILSRLPLDIRMEWARTGEGHESDLNWLLDFLQHELQRRERSQTFEAASLDHTKAVAVERRGRVTTAAALYSSSDKSHCQLCNKPHLTEKCWKLIKLSVSARREQIAKSGLCFCCFAKDHRARQCEAICTSCQGKHHVLLCGNRRNDVVERVNVPKSSDVQTNESVNDRGNSVQVSLNCRRVNSAAKSPVMLQTACVRVTGQHGSAKAVVLFDTGSDRSYVSSRLIQRLNPKWVGSQPVSYVAFGNLKPGPGKLRNIYEIGLRGLKGEESPIEVTEVPTICPPLYRPSLPCEVSALFGDLEFADMPEGKLCDIDILIGLDVYWKLVLPEVKRPTTGEGYVAQRTLFGWIISGAGPTPDRQAGTLSHQLLCLNDLPEAVVRSFWDLESIGITGSEQPVTDPVVKKFEEAISFSNGRYEVALPWKVKPPKLLDNEKLARQRLQGLSKRLAKNPVLECQYNQALQEMENNKVIEEVPAEERESPYPTFYMPHRPVVKESSTSTRVRPVFDASATGFNGVSLNDCLETGPSMIPNLAETLVRFRRWPVALTADVSKAFLQIGVRREDRDVHRFLWNRDGMIRVMRFLRVPFGNKSSPFLLNATIRHHLASLDTTQVVTELQENLYVDDWLSGADEEFQACDMLKEATEIMEQAGMILAKWGSNSSAVSELLYREFEGKYTEDESIKVLGMKWASSNDHFSFNGVEVSSDLCITKRAVLSILARLFDPLGFLTPYVMVVKCLFQDLWKMGLEWDEPVPEGMQKRFRQWVEGLSTIRGWEIPRSYTGQSWRDIKDIELQAFGDASEVGYGACVYVRVRMKDDTWVASLVMSKAKVAPLKRVTLPRLELLGAVLCARLLVFVRRALKLDENVGYRCWTDSRVALAWIQSEASRWKTFIANRVAEIQGLTNPSQWAHCPGQENPADMVTRGVQAQELVSSHLWLKGPGFLQCRESSPNSMAIREEVIRVQAEEERNLTMSSVTVGQVGRCLEIERWGTFNKAVRVVGWVLRFVHNTQATKSELRKGDLTFRELELAKAKLLHCTQRDEYDRELECLKQGRPIPKSSPINRLSPFIDGEGLLRVEGRLQFASLSYDEKHPIIIPKSHLALLLVRFCHVLLKHAGVATMLTYLRNRYWIVGLRRLAKRAKGECVACQRQDARPYEQTRAPLPKDRVTQSPPFSITGIDHAGPLYCCDFTHRKFYVLLFTCAVVRAVHLELVDSLTTEDTMLALRRFAARRGLPSVIYSDNARNFTKAQNQLLKVFGPVSPEWKFIAPRAPWWGGFWERMVRSVKTALRRTLGARSLTRVEMETTLHEVEACLNSRPLTFVGDELESGYPLTPSHFLIGRTTVFASVSGSEVPVVGTRDLAIREELRKQQLDEFWECWCSDYIRSLPPWKGGGPKGRPREGSIVLLEEEGCRRWRWPLGIIKQVFRGRDGKVRALEVRTHKGVYTRPIQKIHDLEISDGVNTTSLNTDSKVDRPEPRVNTSVDRSRVEEEPQGTPAPVDSTQVTRYGRIVKPRIMLDL